MNSSRGFWTDQIYHICNKSISGFKIFKDSRNSTRFFKTLDYYNSLDVKKSFSKYLRENKDSSLPFILGKKTGACVKILTYCIMPDHYHLLVRALHNNSVSKYINNVQNSYTRYFNTKFKRKGPLWQSRFRAVTVNTDAQLLHTSRYIHLNPVTAYFVEKPEDWEYSSYKTFITTNILKDLKEFSIRSPLRYKKFVEDQKDHQRKLARIKKLLLE